MLFSDINFLDINFYASIPIWIYIIIGVIILFFIICTICCCCTSASHKKKMAKLELRDIELDKRELELDRRRELEMRKKERDRDMLDEMKVTQSASTYKYITKAEV